MQMAILDQKYPQLLYNVINFGSLAFDQDLKNKNWKWIEGMLKWKWVIKKSTDRLNKTPGLMIINYSKWCNNQVKKT